MQTNRPLWIGLVMLPAIFSTRLHAASFQGLGDLSGGTFFSVATAISADGGVVVGYSNSSNGYEAFRWTPTNGMVGLGDLPGGSFDSGAYGVSADGSIVVGNSSSTPGYQAFRWTATNGMIGLGDLAGGIYNSIAWAVSGDGQTIVGESSSALCPFYDEAFRWTQPGGMVGLGDLPGGNASSQAFAISQDGSIIVGASGSSNVTSGVWEAFRWTTNGMVGLGDLPGGYSNSVAYGISPDGKTIVGRGHNGNEAAIRWTSVDGMVYLGALPCDTWSTAHAVSADGSVIVGDPYQGANGDCVFIWDAQHGIRNLHTVLSNDYGLNLTGWKLGEAHGISADGKIIIGYGKDPGGNTEAWLANLNPPGLAIGLNTTNIVLSWATNISGFVIETNSSLIASNSWKTNSSIPSIRGTNFVVTNSINAGPQFFRLRKP